MSSVLQAWHAIVCQKLSPYLLGAPANDALTLKTQRYAVAYLFKNVPQILANITLMPLIMAAMFWAYVPRFKLLVWLVASLLLAFARLLLSRRYAQLPNAEQAYRRWAHYFTLSSFCSGVLWGMAAIVFFVPSSIAAQVLLYVAIVGLAAGCIIITCYWLPSYFAYAVPSVGLSGIHFLLQPQTSYQLLGGLLLMYLLIVSKIAINQSQHAYQTIQLGFENSALVEQLTEQKRLAEQANTEKSRFLAAASHDLRQPLHALQLYLASINPKQAIEAQPQVWQGMHKSMSSLQSLFDSLLDLSRLDAGMLTPHWRDFSLRELLDGFVGEYQNQAAQKGLQFALVGEDVAVRSDPILLETILRNLISNAIRYTPQGAVTIAWQLEPESQKIKLSVCDTGIGIDDAYQKEVFNEYFQVSNPERDKNKGLGLGLAIVKRLAALLQSPIQVQSQLGQGATFSLLLAQGVAPEALNQAPIFVPESAQSFMQKRVLVIDDEAIVRDSMTQLLTHWGCQVLAVESYQDAKAQCIKRGKIHFLPELIIADFRLRENQNGAHAVLQLRQDFNAEVPSLIITGDTAPERLKEVKQYDLPYMHKPISAPKLKIFLRQALNKHYQPF